jgi:hypothetical protein
MSHKAIRTSPFQLKAINNFTATTFSTFLSLPMSGAGFEPSFLEIKSCLFYHCAVRGTTNYCHDMTYNATDRKKTDT